MATFNGTDWTFADFSGADGYAYAENWDPFWTDVIAEMDARREDLGNALVATSATNSVAIGTGTKTLTVASPFTKGFVAGMYVVAVDASNSANAITGRVTSYDTGTGALDISVPTGGTTGSGTPSSWVIGISGAVGPQGPTGLMPLWGGTAGGTANALTATTGTSLSSLTRGQIIGVRVGASANSGSATLAVDSASAVTIRRNGSLLVGGELAANTDVWLQYDGTVFRLIGGAGGEDTNTSIAAASTVDIGSTSARAITITVGTGPITAWGTASAGAHRDITFATSVALTYNSVSAILVGGGNITTQAGDTCRMESLGSGNWRMLSYQRANGQALGTGASSQTLSLTDHAAGIAITNNALTATNSSGALVSGRAATAMTAAVYWEVAIDVIATNVSVGIATASVPLTDYISNNAGGYAYGTNGNKANNSSGSAFGATYGAGDRLCFCYNPTTNKVWAGKVISGAAVWGGSGDPASDLNPMFSTSGTLYPAYTLLGTGSAVTFAFSRSQMLAAPPAGFSTFA